MYETELYSNMSFFFKLWFTRESLKRFIWKEAILCYHLLVVPSDKIYPKVHITAFEWLLASGGYHGGSAAGAATNIVTKKQRFWMLHVKNTAKKKSTKCLPNVLNELHLHWCYRKIHKPYHISVPVCCYRKSRRGNDKVTTKLPTVMHRLPTLCLIDNSK